MKVVEELPSDRFAHIFLPPKPPNSHQRTSFCAEPFFDPHTGTTLLVAALPTITATDVSTVQLIAKGDQDHTYWELDIVLQQAGGKKFFKATTAARGSKLVVVLDGEVLTVPNIVSAVGTRFRLTGGSIHTEGLDIFNKLTAK